MNRTGQMQRGIVFIASVLFQSCCTAQPRIAPPDPADDAYGLLVWRMETVLQTGLYGSGTEPGDPFLYIEFPGIPFDLSELSFSVRPDYPSRLEELNKAYRFSTLTNRLIRCDTVRRTARVSADRIEVEQAAETAYLRSPTYNDDFLPAFPAPAVREHPDTWCSASYRDSAHRISFSLKRIPVQRGVAVGSFRAPAGYPAAFIREIILVKNLTWFRKGTVRTPGSEKITVRGIVIIGYICYFFPDLSTDPFKF